MFGYGATMALRLGSTLIMTRLLTPDVFGVMAIAMIVQIIVSLMADLGIHQTVIQSKRGDSDALLNTAWTVQVLRGVAIWFICLLVAAGIGFGSGSGWITAESVYGAPELPSVIAVLTFAAVIVGFQSTNMITAYRNLSIKRVMLINFNAQLGSLIFMAILGWYTRSIWSFVAGGLLHAAIVTVLSHTWLPGTQRRFQWDRESIQELKSYGSWVLMSSGIFVIAANSDRLLLGGWTDAATLGLYSLAFNLTGMLSQAGEQLFSQVGMPAMSEKAREDKHALARVYFAIRKPFDVLFLVGSGFLFAAGQIIIDVLYDERYASAGMMLQALSCMLVFSRYSVAFNAYLAMGLPRYYFYVNVTKLVSIFTLLPAAYVLYGLNASIWAIALHMAPVVPLVFWLNSRHGLNNFRFEALVLLAWPVGYFIGEAANWLVDHARTF